MDRSWLDEVVRVRALGGMDAAAAAGVGPGQDRPERGRPGIAIELPSRTMTR
jgi:hypothetical protein